MCAKISARLFNSLCNLHLNFVRPHLSYLFKVVLNDFSFLDSNILLAACAIASHILVFASFLQVFSRLLLSRVFFVFSTFESVFSVPRVFQAFTLKCHNGMEFCSRAKLAVLVESSRVKSSSLRVFVLARVLNVLAALLLCVFLGCFSSSQLRLELVGFILTQTTHLENISSDIGALSWGGLWIARSKIGTVLFSLELSLSFNSISNYCNCRMALL